MESSYDVVIVGAGIVGLSTAMCMTTNCPELRVLVLEKEPAIAAHQTGHNSGVIHSGVYYRPGSLKAQFCVQGAAAMVQFCRDHNIPFEICGKVIVATSNSELPALKELHRRAVQNGVPNVELTGPERLREFEPHAAGIAALYVPGTGIVNYSLVARKYAELVTASGGEIRTGTHVTGIQSSDSFIVETNHGPVRAKYLINCAGLHSDRIARLAGAELKLQIIPFRGEYYELIPERRTLVRSLIYPVADPRFPFLGVHFTRRIGGEVEAGPNAVLALKREGYRKSDVSAHDFLETIAFQGFWRMAGKYWRTGMHEMYRSFSKTSFVHGLQKLVPEVREADVVPAGSGVRAQAVGPSGALLDDFHFVSQERALHVCNVPSPAATASLMIGRAIMLTAAKHFGLNVATADLTPSLPTA